MDLSDKTPLGCLYHWERTEPNRLHFTQPVGGGAVVEYTWRDVMNQVRRMAAHLASLGLSPRSQIALLGKNSAHWMMADWAIWMAGHVTVPLYPTLNADTVAYILEHSESKLLFVGKLDDWNTIRAGIPKEMPGIALPLAPDTGYRAWDDIVRVTEPLAGEPDRDLEEMATIVYTSGSTGRPKGVMQNFNSFRVCGTGLRDFIEVSPDDRLLSYLPLAHVLERVAVQNLSTYYGLHVFFAESLETFADDLRRARPTIFFSVPRLWTKFQAAVAEKIPPSRQKVLFRIPFVGKRVKRMILEKLGLEHVRFAGTGSAPLPASTIAWYREIGLELLEGYGMTENCGYSHFTRPGQERLGFVGHANPGVECRIADNGEVLVKSPGQMLGYFKMPEQTAECLTEDGFLKTGDMGVIDEVGRLKITGRVKELFKTTKGKYVAPAPIEGKLGSHPDVELACVCGANQPASFALVMLSDAARGKNGAREALAAELEGLMREVNDTLDPHERMQFLVAVSKTWTIENGFLTPTLKIRRSVIEEFYAPRVDGWFAAGRKVIWEE